MQLVCFHCLFPGCSALFFHFSFKQEVVLVSTNRYKTEAIILHEYLEFFGKLINGPEMSWKERLFDDSADSAPSDTDSP